MKLSELSSNAVKAVYLWLAGQQQATPKQIEKELGISESHVSRALLELKSFGFVFRISFGVYSAAGGVVSPIGGAVGK